MITRVPWDETADAALSRALPNPVTRGFIASEVQRGVSQLYLCEAERHRAYVVTRVDTCPLEYVVVAYEGTGMQHFAPAFIGAARERQLPMRVHVTSPIVERLLRRVGFVRTESILRFVA